MTLIQFSLLVRYGTTTFGDLLKQKQRKDGSLIWVRISTDEDIHRLQDDDVIYIKDMKRDPEWRSLYTMHYCNKLIC